MKGMILAAKYARENKVPYLGICLGMQISVIEFARSVSVCFFFSNNQTSVFYFVFIISVVANPHPHVFAFS